MTDLLIQSVPSRGDTFPRGLLDTCRTAVVTRYGRSAEPSSELKHSKSDELILQGSSPKFVHDYQHLRCDSPVPKATCLVYEDDIVATHILTHRNYLSDSETDTEPSCASMCNSRVMSPEFQRSNSRNIGLYDKVDPEDSIRDMITENDFYRFVMFKTHYEKYLHLSQKYEEARHIAYYLEEKYHEVKAERDGLGQSKQELERKLESRELELHEKEEELFLQLEKVVRLEEDCEKLRAEKEKMLILKDQLEKEKLEAYRQLKKQATESEKTRINLERARQEVMMRMTEISAEKDSLERENVQLKETLHDERKGLGQFLVDLTIQKKRASTNLVGLEKEVSELKYIAKQSASLNNQFKKGMKHLATCKRKKCSVCAYTKATFGEYAERNDKKLLSCFQAPLQDIRNWIRPVPLSTEKLSALGLSDEEYEDNYPGASNDKGCSSPYCVHNSSQFPSSEYSLRRNYSPELPSPSPSVALLSCGNAISYIDDDSTTSESSCDSGLIEPICNCPSVPTDTSTSSAPPAGRAFSSDSGFSSELYDSHHKKIDGDGKAVGFQRSKWTSSFRKLINKVSKRSTTE